MHKFYLHDIYVSAIKPISNIKNIGIGKRISSKDVRNKIVSKFERSQYAGMFS